MRKIAAFILLAVFALAPSVPLYAKKQPSASAYQKQQRKLQKKQQKAIKKNMKKNKPVYTRPAKS